MAELRSEDVYAKYSGPLKGFRDMVNMRHTLEDNFVGMYQDLVTKYAQKMDDYHSDQTTLRLLQRECTSLERQRDALQKDIQAMRQSAANNAFVYVILDGDGAIFREEFMRKGLEGGEEAAHMLRNEIEAYIKDIDPEFNVTTIIVQVVLNLVGLQSALHATHTVKNADLADFARGFSRAQPLFSMIDVGSGKEQTDNKARQLFDVMVANFQCKHLIFGPCHDNGYVPWLRPGQSNADTRMKLTLLEATPPASEYAQLNFRRAKFPNVFRTEMLPSKPPVGAMLPPPGLNGGSGSPVTRHSTLLPNRNPSPVATQMVQRSPDIDSPGSASSWAALSRTGSIGGAIDITPRKTAPVEPKPREYALFNKDERRLDQKLPVYDSALYTRMTEESRKLGTNLCNRYYLRNNCPDGDRCRYRHGKPLTDKEILCLRHMTRMIPCGGDSWCVDIGCVLGHHCRNPNSCTFSNCKFSQCHGMDLKPTLKMYEDGTNEWL